MTRVTDQRCVISGNCYSNAWEEFMAMPAARKAVLVHGWPMFGGSVGRGPRYGHAWVEYTISSRTSRRVTSMSGRIVPVAIFRHGAGVGPAHAMEYTREQALEKYLAHDTKGPWELPADWMAIPGMEAKRLLTGACNMEDWRHSMQPGMLAALERLDSYVIALESR